jgi:predicted transcriptional regulator
LEEQSSGDSPLPSYGVAGKIDIVSTVQEIIDAVTKLSREELADFRKWFWKFDQDAWDKEIEDDAAAGRLDSVIREIDKDIRAGRLTDLPVSAKMMVLEAIQKLPDESTFAEIRERVEFIAGVRKGLDEIERGEVVALDEVEKKIDKWATK